MSRIDQVSVFVSYAHETKEHLAWVTYLADRLQVLPDFEVIFDRYDLHAGKDLTHFMERGVAAARIVVVVTPQYVQKARERRGGVGYESSIISADVLRDQLSGRVVPSLRLGDDRPDFLRSKVFVDFREDAEFDRSFDDLVASLRGLTPAARPPKGSAVPPYATGKGPTESAVDSEAPVVIASLPVAAANANEYFGPIELENIGKRDAFNVDIAEVSNKSQLARFSRIPRLRPGEKVEVTPVIEGADHTRNGYADLYKFVWVGQIGRAWDRVQTEELDRAEISRELQRGFAAPVRISYHDFANRSWTAHCELMFGRDADGLYRLTIQFRRVERD